MGIIKQNKKLSPLLEQIYYLVESAHYDDILLKSTHTTYFANCALGHCKKPNNLHFL